VLGSIFGIRQSPNDIRNLSSVQASDQRSAVSGRLQST
jgi:hypothetical protein